MYDAFVRMIDVPYEGIASLQSSILRFGVVFFGSLAVGVFFGFTSALHRAPS